MSASPTRPTPPPRRRARARAWAALEAARLLLAAAPLAAWLLIPAAGAAETGDQALPGAADIVEEVMARQRTSGFDVRATAQVRPPEDEHRPDGPMGKPDDEAGQSVQLMARGRREDDGSSQVLVVAMWPRARRGEALMIERTADGAVGGFRFTPPDAVTPLERGDLNRPLFGTPLTVDDLAESFWAWPSQQTVGRDRIGRRDCWRIESRPDAAAAFPMVRSCVAADELVPLEIERHDAEGRLFARITFERLVQREGGTWAPAAFTIESPATGDAVEVRFSRGDRDLTFARSDFTVDAVRALIGLD